MSKPITEVGADPIERATDLRDLFTRVLNEATSGQDQRPFMSLSEAESDTRKEFEALSDRIYRQGRDSSFAPSLVKVSALRVAASALRIAAMAGRSE